MIKKFFLFIILIAFIVGVYGVFKTYLFSKKFFVPTSRGNIKQLLKNFPADYFKTKTPFGILLLGYAGGNHDGTYLTDTMILVYVEPANSSVTLVSLPRDIWVKLPTGKTGSFWKINAAYALGMDDTGFPDKPGQYKGQEGAGNMAKFAASSVLGLSVDRFVAVNFDAFVKAIDILGGIDVTVEKTFDDYEYPIDGSEKDLCGHKEAEIPDLTKDPAISPEVIFPCRYEHLHFDAGKTHMDGKTALKFVRSRHAATDGSDFGRSRRQRSVILAVKEKIMSLEFIPKIIPFISTLQNDVRTDTSPRELQEFLKMTNNLRNYKIKSIALTDKNILKYDYSQSGQSILTSQEGVGQWNAAQEWIRNILKWDSLEQSVAIKVENDTDISGFAKLAVERLQSTNVSAAIQLSSSSNPLTKSEIHTFNKQFDESLLFLLKHEFGVSNIVKESSQGATIDVLVRIGEDYQKLHQ